MTQHFWVQGRAQRGAWGLWPSLQPGQRVSHPGLLQLPSWPLVSSPSPRIPPGQGHRDPSAFALQTQRRPSGTAEGATHEAPASLQSWVWPPSFSKKWQMYPHLTSEETEAHGEGISAGCGAGLDSLQKRSFHRGVRIGDGEGTETWSTP